LGREGVAVASEQTLVLVKPDGVQRGLVGEIIRRLERRGLRIAALDFLVIDRDLASVHYAEHEGKPFYAGLVDYIGSGPSVALVLEGPDAIKTVRTTVGATNPAEAAPGTIRGDLGLERGRNLIHASDGAESAAREIKLFFGDKNVLTYERDLDRWIVE
jgi:nucleoside-diphosphate kinase